MVSGACLSFTCKYQRYYLRVNFVFIETRRLVTSFCAFILLTATQRYSLVLIVFFPFTFAPVSKINGATAFELQRMNNKENFSEYLLG